MAGISKNFYIIGEIDINNLKIQKYLIILKSAIHLSITIHVQKVLKLLEINNSTISINNFDRSKVFIFKFKKNKIIFLKKNYQNQEFNM